MPRDSHSSVSHALRRIVDAAEDLIDEALDRAEDVEHDMRDSLSRALDDDEPPRRRRRRQGRGTQEESKAAVPRMRDPDELDALRQQLETLTHRLERLSDAQK
jgi:ubiquinone biosynthesis protein UbiJ